MKKNKVEMVYEDLMNNVYSSHRLIYNQIRADEENTVMKFTVSNGVITEAIDWEVEKGREGGIITFSTDVNSVKLSNNEFINKLKQFGETLKNRFRVKKKVDKVLQKNEVFGCTVGNFMHGRYYDKSGKVYDERSMSVEIIGMTYEDLIKIAEQLCAEFKQETVLVKSNGEHHLVFVNSNNNN